MTKKTKKKATPKNSLDVRMKELCSCAVNTGEVLGNEITTLLSKHGSNLEGLMIETYALAKAWAVLMVIAKFEEFKAEEFFKMLLPSFVEEFEAIFKEEMQKADKK